jgi:hypothetical protein
MSSGASQMKKRLVDTAEALAKRLSPYFIPSALLIYGLVITLVFPILNVIERKFAEDVADPSSIADPLLKGIVTVVIYVAFIALALVITVILLGSVLVGIALVYREVARIVIQVWRSVQRTLRGAQRTTGRGSSRPARQAKLHSHGPRTRVKLIPVSTHQIEPPPQDGSQSE